MMDSTFIHPGTLSGHTLIRHCYLSDAHSPFFRIFSPSCYPNCLQHGSASLSVLWAEFIVPFVIPTCHTPTCVGANKVLLEVNSATPSCTNSPYPSEYLTPRQSPPAKWTISLLALSVSWRILTTAKVVFRRRSPVPSVRS